MANNPSKITTSRWDQKNKLFYTQISGLVGLDEVKNWEAEMRQESQKIPPDTRFKFLADERNYQFESPEVNKYKRDVMPRFLASFAFKLSVLSADEKKTLDETVALNKNNIQCIAMAMVHHDKEKMQALQHEFGQQNEKYLSDLTNAENWLKNDIDS